MAEPSNPEPGPRPAQSFAELPLFPLGTVLFPQGLLDLQIFEVRYLDMIGKCYRAGTPFGVVGLTQGAEVRTRDDASPAGDGFAVEQFADVGTLAHIVELQAPQAGLLRIRCQGAERFRIQARRRLTHGLWVAQAHTVPDDVPQDIPQDLRPVAHTLSSLIEAQHTGEAPLQLPMLPPYRLDDCGWVANRWCDLLPLPLAMKQSLLQLDNPLLRLELVGDLLNQRPA